MSKPDLLPTPAEAKPGMIPTTFSLDQENLDWLDKVAEDTKRNRSDTLREILRNVRESQAQRAS